MNKQYFTDTVGVTLTPQDDTLHEWVDETSDGTFDPGDAETVTRDGPWTDFFDTNQFVAFDATVAKPIVQPYKYNGQIKRFRKTEAELKDAQAQIENLPWTMGHPPKDRVTHADQIRGVWTDPRWEDGQQATLHIPANDPEAIRYAVHNDEISVGFGGTLDWDETADGYDATQRSMAYDHIASVENGRCPPEKGCGLHTDDSTDLHGHMTDAAMPSFEEGDLVRWQVWPDKMGRIVHNPSDRDYVMVEVLEMDGGEMSETGFTLTAGYSDIITVDPSMMDVPQIRESDATRSKLTEEQLMNDENFAVGDWVKWDASNGPAHGKIDEIVREGCTTRGKGSQEVCAEDDDPAVVIEHYDGSEPSGDMVRHEMSTLESWVGPQTDHCPGDSCSCGCHRATDVEINGKTIDLTVPDSAQSAAEAFLEAKEEGLVGEDCGTGAGTTSAEMIASGEVSAERLESDIAPYLHSHEEDVSRDNHPDDWPDEAWQDCGDAQYAAWGWLSLLEWARRTADEIKRARGDDPVYTDAVPRGITTHEGGWYGIAPDENPDEEYKYELDNCNDVKDAYNLRNNGDYDIETDTLVSRIKRAAQAHNCPPEQKPWTDSMDLDYETDGNSLGSMMMNAVESSEMEPADAKEQIASEAGIEPATVGDIMRGDIQCPPMERLEAIADVLDASVDDVMAAASEDGCSYENNDAQHNNEDNMTDADDPTDFYDGEPSVEQLADDFTAVEALVDSKESLEDEVETLNDELRSYRVEDFREKAEELATLVDSRNVEDMVEQFEDDELTIDQVEEHIDVAREALGESTTTVDSAGGEGDNQTETEYVADNATRVDETDIDRTQGGRYDLRSVRRS